MTTYSRKRLFESLILTEHPIPMALYQTQQNLVDDNLFSKTMSSEFGPSWSF